MLEDILGTLLRSQIGDLKKRTRWAVLEGAALGMVGLATVFLFIALQIWLSSRIEAWLSALIVAGAALLVALILMLVGRSFLQRSARRREQDFQSLLGGLGVLSKPKSVHPHATDDKAEPGIAIVGAALAAGVLLGRSFRR